MTVELLNTYGILHIGVAEFLFDLDDLPIIKGRDSWYCDKDGYLVSSYFYCGVRRFVRFHRLVMHAKPGQFVDHINKNKADNRKENLRCCQRSENDRNRSLYITNTSGVSGVFFEQKRLNFIGSSLLRKHFWKRLVFVPTELWHKAVGVKLQNGTHR